VLEIRELNSPSDKQQLLTEFHPNDQCWVVPDLVSKKNLQQIFLSKNRVIEEDSCLRASDLWQKLLSRLRPDLRVVPPSLIMGIIKSHLSESLHAWARTPGASDELTRYVRDLMPILSHPDAEEIMSDWFGKNQSAFVRWGHWFKESYTVWRALNKMGIVTREWISGILVNETGFEKVWQRQLVFDLGVEIISPETELISVLSRYLPVSVIKPTPAWSSEYPSLFAPYSFLATQRSKKIEPLNLSEKNPPSEFTYRKFASGLGEIKDAVAQARLWLDQGVHPSNVAILAPEVREVWPCLKEFLSMEGIPFRPRETELLANHPQVAHWLSVLKLKGRELTRGNLEMDLYHLSKDSKAPLRYEEFERFYTNIYSFADLGRHPLVSARYKNVWQEKNIGTKFDFISLAIAEWKAHWNSELIEGFIYGFFDQTPDDLKLSLNIWLDYLTAELRRADITLRPESMGGVQIENLVSSANIEATHVYILGLKDSSFRGTRKTSILESDIKSLSEFTGFNLSSLDRSNLEFYLKWFLLKPIKDCILSFAANDLSGKVEAPSLVWLQKALEIKKNIKETDAHGLTRWDEIQAQSPENININKDLGLEPFAPLHVDFELGLSATGIRNYKRCPFVYLTQNVLRLADRKPFDLDLDSMEMGKLLHRVLETVVTHPFTENYTSEELDQIIANSVADVGVVFLDPKLGQYFQAELKKTTIGFLKKEYALRQKFPELSTLAKEVQFKAYIDSESGDFSIVPKLQSRGASFKCEGFVDRIDENKCREVSIIDYKSSGYNLKTLGSWIKDSELQLPIYAMAVEQGLTELGPREVISAHYCVVKDDDRNIGFKIIEKSGTLYDCEDKKRNKLELSKKKDLFVETKKQLKHYANEMGSGHFAPLPEDEKKCNECRWRLVCRAPHLL